VLLLLLLLASTRPHDSIVAWKDTTSSASSSCILQLKDGDKKIRLHFRETTKASLLILLVVIVLCWCCLRSDGVLRYVRKDSAGLQYHESLEVTSLKKIFCAGYFELARNFCGLR